MIVVGPLSCVNLINPVYFEIFVAVTVLTNDGDLIRGRTFKKSLDTKSEDGFRSGFLFSNSFTYEDGIGAGETLCRGKVLTVTRHDIAGNANRQEKQDA